MKFGARPGCFLPSLLSEGDMNGVLNSDGIPRKDDHLVCGVLTGGCQHRTLLRTLLVGRRR